MDTPASISHLGVMFGQYVDHDFALTASTGIGSTPLKCTCGSSNQDCVNIPTPSEELLNDQDCEVLTRSGASFDKFDCTLGQREQTNMLTHWLDMSQVCTRLRLVLQKEIEINFILFSDIWKRYKPNEQITIFLARQAEDIACGRRWSEEGFYAAC